jgi:hypothetical protein
MTKKYFFHNGIKSIFLEDGIVKLTLFNSTPNESNPDEIELICTFDKFKLFSDYMDQEKSKMIDFFEKNVKNPTKTVDEVSEKKVKRSILSSVKNEN